MDFLFFISLSFAGFLRASCTTVNYAVDNSIQMWADDSSVGTLEGWNNPATATISDNTGILAVQAYNAGGPAGFLASLDNGMVTNSEWRCTASDPGGSAWRVGGFDDSGWEVATEYGVNGASPWGLITGVSAGARWIWTSDNEAVGNVYCRIRIGVEVLATCDNTIWVFADGVDYTTSGGSTQNGNWPLSEYYILPRGTEVFGIKCTDAGGQWGILGSVYNGPVTDLENWKCTSEAQSNADWSRLDFDDYSWGIPTFWGHHGIGPWGNLQNPYPISLDAVWIWSDGGEYSTAYCRVSIETPTTCWTPHADTSSVLGLIVDPQQQNRSNTFYFGNMGDDVDECAAACARESHCAAYTLYSSTYTAAWAGQCYGRSDSYSTLASATNAFTAVKISCATELPETGDRVSECTGLPNGNYQSTGTCNEYITCTDGVMTSHTCSANQYWDDDLGRCDFVTSTCTDACSVGPCQHGGTCVYSGDSYTCTCPTNVNGDNCETVTIPTGECVTDCSGVANGYYTSCSSCSVYAQCQDGTLTDDIACDENTFWDDEEGSCVAESQTCFDYCSVDTRTQCISDSDGQTLCENLGCCWDDSDTPNCFHSNEPAVSESTTVTCSVAVDFRTECGYDGIQRQECLGYGCCWYTQDDGAPWCFYGEVPSGDPVTDCHGVADGDYQSSGSCSEYIRCADGDLETLTCPDGQYFDDDTDSCGDSSDTCSDSDETTDGAVDTTESDNGGSQGGSNAQSGGGNDDNGMTIASPQIFIPLAVIGGLAVGAATAACVVYAAKRKKRQAEEEEGKGEPEAGAGAGAGANSNDMTPVDI